MHHVLETLKHEHPEINKAYFRQDNAGCYHSTRTIVACREIGVANGTSKNVGLGKFWQDLEISEAFLASLEVLFFHGLLLLFLSLETFHQRVSGSDF